LHDVSLFILTCRRNLRWCLHDVLPFLLEENIEEMHMHKDEETCMFVLALYIMGE
jgi:hypothetical protein